MLSLESGVASAVMSNSDTERSIGGPADPITVMRSRSGVSGGPSRRTSTTRDNLNPRNPRMPVGVGDGGGGAAEP